MSLEYFKRPEVAERIRKQTQPFVAKSVTAPRKKRRTRTWTDLSHLSPEVKAERRRIQKKDYERVRYWKNRKRQYADLSGWTPEEKRQRHLAQKREYMRNKRVKS